MTTQRIVLANDSRLVREMLKRIFLKSSSLEVAFEIDDHKNLAEEIEDEEVEWVILSLPVNNHMPRWIDSYLERHPLVHFLAVSSDGSQVKMKCREKKEEHLVNLSLHDLLYLLEKHASEQPVLQTN